MEDLPIWEKYSRTGQELIDKKTRNKTTGKRADHVFVKFEHVTTLFIYRIFMDIKIH